MIAQESRFGVTAVELPFRFPSNLPRIDLLADIPWSPPVDGSIGHTAEGERKVCPGDRHLPWRLWPTDANACSINEQYVLQWHLGYANNSRCIRVGRSPRNHTPSDQPVAWLQRELRLQPIRGEILQRLREHTDRRAGPAKLSGI